jgi:hypothetical protein
MASTPVLWWDNTIVAAASITHPMSTVLPSDGDSIYAFCGFLEGLSPTPKAIRLIYTASTLETVTTPCPKTGDRNLMQKVLGPKFEAIKNPGTAWAAHKPRTTGSGAATVLYIEQQPRLQRLRSVLQDRGIELEAAFPLTSLIDLAPEAVVAKPLIALLHSDEGAAVAWTTPEGDRHTAFFRGENAGERTMQELATGFAAFAGKAEPVFIAVNASSQPMDEAVLPRKPNKYYNVAEFIALNGRLTPRDLLNLLPPPPSLTIDTAIFAVVLVVAGIALFQGFGYLSALHTARTSRRAQESQEAQLAKDNERFGANKAQFDRQQAVLDECQIAPQVKTKFIEAVGRARPQQITIRSMTLNEQSWSIAGTLHQGAAAKPSPLDAFISQLGQNASWTINAGDKPAVPKQTPGSDQRPVEFTITGVFN